ncbi:MAG: transglycosylase SLT domain-containing protein [Candidatus Margulisbacteria bacterium]|jgi:soluble lytic murein transglycosylase|nr:transglycosylase SLT domain-containing protein [Candidatus Margulisiibacteriota bacterium]
MIKFLVLLIVCSFSCAAKLDYAQAKKYFADGRYAEAAKTFAYVGAHRRHLKSYCDYYRAAAAFEQGRYAESARLLEKYTAQANIPYKTEALELLNENYLKLKRDKEVHPLAAYGQALKLFHKSDYAGALRLLKVVSANNALSVLPEDAYYYLARSYMYCAEPQTARKILGSRSGAGAVYYLGVLAQRQKQHKLADSRFLEVWRKYPDSDYAPQALFNLARQSSGQLRLNYYRRLYQRYPQSRYADDAAWEAGWTDYQNKQYRAAAEIWLAGYALDKKSDNADALLYWSGKARQKLGDKAGAEQIFVRARREFPARFYGWRAAQQLGLSPELPAGSLRLQDVRPRTNKTLREFLAIGAYDDAQAEAGLIADKEQKKQTLSALKIYLADAAHQAGDYKEAILLALDALDSNPDYAAILPELWRICYPKAFVREVEKHSRAYALDENYVYALIREESLYDEFALSPANACGLMQLLPRTAAQILQKLNISADPEPEALYQPDINILLGAYYLREMLNRFEGSPYLALAAYNAGPAAAGRWLKPAGGIAGMDVDAFVENIRYPETRNYVKRVMRGCWLYAALYAED